MIIDRIENAALYYPLHPKFKQAFDYIAQIDIHTLPVGRQDIDDGMYVLAQKAWVMLTSITCNKANTYLRKIFFRSLEKVIKWN